MFDEPNRQEIEKSAWIEGDRLTISHGGHWALKAFGTFCILAGLAIVWGFAEQPPADLNGVEYAIALLIMLGFVGMGLAYWTWRISREFDRQEGTLHYGWKIFGIKSFSTVRLQDLGNAFVSSSSAGRYGKRCVVSIPCQNEDNIYLHEFSNNLERAEQFARKVNQFLREGRSILRDYG